MFANAHLQTIWGPRLRKQQPPARMLEKCGFKDGDHYYLHWAGPTPTRALVVILHGLAGCSESQYVVGLQSALSARGVASVAVNFRSAARRPNDRLRTYHSGETEDVREILDALAVRFAGVSLLPVGYSLGGSRLLNLLAEGGHAAVPTAVSVCVPLDLAACQARLNQGFSKVYRNVLITELVQSLRDKLPHLQQVAPAEAEKLRALGSLDGIETFHDYDARVICPMFGFATPEEYYARSSAKPKLKQITTPALMIQASDDPFMTDAIMPSTSELSDVLTLEVRPGGHVGFVDGLPWRPRYWLEQRIPDYLAPWL